ncbi:MAG TPA: hypothetical protein DCM14_03890 [Clostridiales bacterium UBA8153]|nr:hypothetical protein [Clostridiales bacterium UBA8153]
MLMSKVELQLFEEVYPQVVPMGEGVVNYASGHALGQGPVIAPHRAPSETRPPQERVVLVWEHVLRRPPDLRTIGPLLGVNVVAPTWFSLAGDQGNLVDRADPAYVTWAHQRGYGVWGVVNNAFDPDRSFDPDRTRAVLTSVERRERLIQQILLFCQTYRLDGINLDFEHVYPQDRDQLTQLAREVGSLAREMGLVVSIDVTPRSTRPNGSLCYDRRALANVLDYVILMAYDEHPAGSPVAGPVASLPWVQTALLGVLE